MPVNISIKDATLADIVHIHEDVDTSNMEECCDYEHCPYCGNLEDGIENAPFKSKAEYERRYVVNGKSYPFEANLISYSDEFAAKHYGVNMEWNEIHCCSYCKKEYYTVHQH